MASLTLYGSSVADSTLTTADDMASTTGGAETSKTTVSTGTNHYVEFFSQGSAGSTGAVSIPATPTGKGWVYKPGAGLFAAGNWSASITVSAGNWAGAGHGANLTLRFFQYSGGVYTSIGTITSNLTGLTKTTYSFSATSMPSVTFNANDLLYTDLWWFDNNTSINSDNPVVYVSSSSSQGVANDMQITTSNFTPGYVIAGTAQAKFYTSKALKSLVRDLFYTKMVGNKTLTSPKFYTRTGLKAGSRAKFPTRISLFGRTRPTFSTRFTALSGKSAAKFSSVLSYKAQTRAKFSITKRYIEQALSVFRTGKHRAIKALLRSEVQHINATFSEVAMSNPGTTIDVSTTVTDMNNAVVTNLTTASALVTFPDGSTSTYTATNQGNGVYVVTYTTKSPGLHRELWNFTDVSGATAQYFNITPVSY